MPVQDLRDASDVEFLIEAFFKAPSKRGADLLRKLVVEKLDFEPVRQRVMLDNATPRRAALPPFAELLGRLSGVTAVYLPLDSRRIRRAEIDAAVRAISADIAGDLLLFASNDDCSTLQVIHQSTVANRSILRRMAIERDFPRRTAIQQVAGIYKFYQDTGSLLRGMERAFDVEAVTSRFFEEYKRVFDLVLNRVEGFDESESEAKRLFVQTLFNRLMFVYFLSRKKWLRFPQDPTNEYDYLNALLRAYERTGSAASFYRNRLKPLFFQALNLRRSPVENSKLLSILGEVPFLNGGLFEETEADRAKDVDVPDTAVRQMFNDLFDRFNFTVMESTPFDIEVAVDPEMLGKVFEELVTGRHETGSYYTPRPVVSFMCREAIKAFLANELPDVAHEALAKFVDEGNPSEMDISVAPRVAEALQRVTVVDPACGSGAYLLGMLHELVELQETLFSARFVHDAENIYELKLRVIERNLYGADIDAFAVNIAMLRLWLSLSVDYDGSAPKPLPNLDFKIVCGNSLIGPDPNPKRTSTLLRHRVHDIASKLSRLKARHLRSSGDEKLDLEEEIREAQEELADAVGDDPAPEGAVDWRVQFGEVFDSRGGFDIAIANPPYVSNERIGSTKALLYTTFTEGVSGKSDLYVFFWLRALQLLSDGGVKVFVCSNTWLDSLFGIELQEFLIKHADLRCVLESEVERQFSTAAVNTAISLVVKSAENRDRATRFVSLSSPFDSIQSELSGALAGDAAIAGSALRLRDVKRDTLLQDIRAAQNQGSPTNWGGKYLRAPSIYLAIMHALQRHGVQLGSYVRGERYLNTGGADGFFILRDVEIDGSLARFKNVSREGRADGSPDFVVESRFLGPGFRSVSHPRLRVDHSDCHVLRVPADTDISRLRVKTYIAWGERTGFADRSVTRTQEPWWKPPVQARQGARVLWPRTHAESHKCYFNPLELISLRFFRLHPNRKDWELPLVAVLNSTVYALLKEIHGRRGLGQGALETGLVDVLPLPVPRIERIISSSVVSAFEPLLDRDIGTVGEEAKKGDRKAADSEVLRVLGLPARAVDDLYDAVARLISVRYERAASV